MKEFQNTYRTLANDLMQSALVGSPIKASEVKAFFEFADNIVSAANAVKSVFSAFHPDIDNDIELKKDVVCKSETNSEPEV